MQAGKQKDPRQNFEEIGSSPACHCGKYLAYCPIGPKDWSKTVSSLDIKELETNSMD
ncbi:MAG: hypothetical protein JW864_04105 [Spirochaetes bacterium]|nr:hypothetical protein [Spirochaetota bacterium]